MIKNLKIKEINENNQKYIPKIAELEDIILVQMENNGQAGQFFPTGEEDIREYALSDENYVFAAVDDQTDDVAAAVYITQGQKPYTYNDLTKYFKFGEKYKAFVRNQYSTREDYLSAMTDAYVKKIHAYIYAKNKILQEHSESKIFKALVDKERIENGFHEKSKIRELLNKYMSQYIISHNNGQYPKEYEYFFWTTLKDIEEEAGMSFHTDKPEYQEIQDDILECDKVISLQKFRIHEPPKFDTEKYYDSNTFNTVELDTYIANPNRRSSGMARIIVYEGIRKALDKFFTNTDNKEIFLCSTLHRENVSSKYVSEFFGLTDSFFLERRQGIDREVHFTSITREQYKPYIEELGKRLAVFYGYNPTRLQISDEERIRITEDQFKYDLTELKNLEKLHPNKGSYLDKRLTGKRDKINRLKQLLENLIKKQKDKNIKGDER